MNEQIMKAINSMRKSVNEMAISSDEDLQNMKRQLLGEARACDPTMSPFILKMLEQVNEFIRIGKDKERRDQLRRMLLGQISQMEEMVRRDLSNRR